MNKAHRPQIGTEIPPDLAEEYGHPDLNNIHNKAASDLGRAIVSGRYAPGKKLPTEFESAERLGISRSSYREATRILAAKGMLVSRTKAGTVVSARSSWNLLDPDVLAWFFQSEPSPSFIHDLFELRMVVEPAAAAMAAVRRTEAQVSEMEKALEIMSEKTLASEAGLAADKHFHTVILEATRNETFISLASGIGAAARWASIFKQRHRELPRDPVPDHMRLLQAIKAKDPEAARHAAVTLLLLAQEDTALSMQS
ncbi:MAG: FadR/GntR family transcriptional regulator [Asticcacaulis sp.]|uniref:FadR/GntR family transcriptional regulator n=1 Tax=Asticcacaulis sp. TaxID=1872648 RepID=UPI0039E35E06